MCASAALLTFFGALTLPVAAGERPNILWIVADDLGWGDLGFRTKNNGGGQIKTPVLDALANEGTVLTNYYVHASCSPTRASFMTGRYPTHHGLSSAIAMFQPMGLALNETTVAQLFRGSGYHTHAIGKWHIGSLSYFHTPTFRGFQSFYGFYTGMEDYKSHKHGKGVDFVRDEGENCGKGCSRPAIEDLGNYSTKLYTLEAIRLIREHGLSASALGVQDPWFIYLAYQAVHFPGMVPQRYSNKYIDVFPGDPQRVKYAGMLSSLDEAVGKILDELRDQDQDQNTIVIFTTDNGGPVRRGASNLPLRGSKGEIWEGGTRGTAMIRGPGVQQPGEYAGFMHAVDWLPTLLAAANVPLRKKSTLPLDGIDLWGSLCGNELAPVRSEIFYGSTGKKSAKMLGPALRVGDYKLLLRGQEALDSESPAFYTPTSEAARLDVSETPLRALFDLRQDPAETRNLAAKHPYVVHDMLVRLRDIARPTVSLNWEDPDCAHPMNTEDQLLSNGTTIKVWVPECDHLYMGVFNSLARLPPLPEGSVFDSLASLPPLPQGNQSRDKVLPTSLDQGGRVMPTWLTQGAMSRHSSKITSRGSFLNQREQPV